MTETDFTQLLDRYTQGLCTTEEKEKLERWMDGIPEREALFKSEAERMKAKRALLASIYNKNNIKEGKSRTLVPVMLRVAAAVTLLLVTAYGIWTIGLKNVNTVQVAEVVESGNIQKVILSDSTIVWLKPGAKLQYPGKFDGKERKVAVTGEALFEVAKDATKPFFVEYGDFTARVVGTSFNIKPTGSNIELLVLTGRVIVSSKTNSENLTVLPNEKVLFNTSDKTLAKVEPQREEPAQSVKGTEYSMSFDHAKMSDILKAIESKFNVKVTVSEVAINNCLLSADFTDQSLGRTLKLISNAMDYTYEIKDDTVTLTGSGCK